MKKVLRSKLLTCILILVLASTIFVFAGDVIVKQGDLDVAGNLTVAAGLSVGGDLDLGEDQAITGYPDAYIHYLNVDYYAEFYQLEGESIHATYQVSSGYCMSSDHIHADKIYCDDVDPARVLFDLQTRQQTIDGTKRVVAPEKQGGAVLFFNKDTKKLETYIPSEGKFYDLQGNLLYTMPTIEVATDYKTIYHLDNSTGEVKSSQELIHDVYLIKKGYRLDTKTGHFINKASGEVIPKETAIEIKEDL